MPAQIEGDHRHLLNPHPIFLCESRVAELLDIDELMPVLERALIEFSFGRVNQPLRTVLAIPEHTGWFGLMPAIYDDVIGAKLVTVFPGNAARGLHTHLATVHLFRAQTGEPLAVLDGRSITAWRTAVVSALATRALSSPNSSVLAILGSGVQAHSHFQALKRVRTFTDIRVWSRTPEHAAVFSDAIGARALPIEEAVRGADVIVTATGATEPFLQGRWLKDGAYVNAVGAVGPNPRELNDDVLTGAAIVVESREAALRESAEIAHSRSSVYAELGEILGGTVPAPQHPRTVYKSLGIAVEDIAAARLVFAKYRETAAGSQL